MSDTNYKKAYKYIKSCEEKIEAPDAGSMEAAKVHWNSIAKPLYGLGLLEDIIVKIAGIKRTHNVRLGNKKTVVMCADNGIVDEHISQSGSDVTAIVSDNIAEMTASVGRLSQYAGADVLAVDVGIKDDTKSSKMQNYKIKRGTNNFLKEPAMSEEEFIAALKTGIDIAERLKAEKTDIIAAGEMGIGNTTTTSAVTAVLLEKAPSAVTGRGAGLDNDSLKHKIEVIEKAIEKYGLQKQDTIKTVICVGGFDIAAIMGLYIGGAMYRIPVVMDGVITAAAALAACRLIPEVRNYIIPSHIGKEPAMQLIANELLFKPIIHADLALGEGTGAVMLFPLLDMALKIYNENACFDELNIEKYEDYGNKG